MVELTKTNINAHDILGQKVKLHWHFYARKYSVSTYEEGVGWRVVRNYGKQVFFGKVVLKDAKFKVSKAGRERARRERRRNVHAWVEGDVIDFRLEPTEVFVPCGSDVYYNPFTYEEAAFMLRTSPPAQTPIYEAPFASIGCKRIGDIHVPQMKVSFK